MATHAPSASTGQYGLMATVWLVLVAMFAALLAVNRPPEPGTAVPATTLEALFERIDAGDVSKTSESLPIVFFERDSAALTEPGRRWLHGLAGHLADVNADVRLRLDILPPARAPEVTAARVAAIAALLGTLDIDMARIDLRTHEAGKSARFGLAAGGQGGAQ